MVRVDNTTNWWNPFHQQSFHRDDQPVRCFWILRLDSWIRFVWSERYGSYLGCFNNNCTKFDHILFWCFLFDVSIAYLKFNQCPWFLTPALVIGFMLLDVGFLEKLHVLLLITISSNNSSGRYDFNQSTNASDVFHSFTRYWDWTWPKNWNPRWLVRGCLTCPTFRRSILHNSQCGIVAVGTLMNDFFLNCLDFFNNFI